MLYNNYFSFNYLYLVLVLLFIETGVGEDLVKTVDGLFLIFDPLSTFCC